MSVKNKQLIHFSDEAKYVESYIVGEVAKYFMAINTETIDVNAMNRYTSDSINKFWRFHTGKVVADASFSDLQCVIISNANQLALKLLGEV